MDFWTRLDQMISFKSLVIDRPKGSRHPTYPEVVYPIDYGYIEGTLGGDGNQLDVWRGSGQSAQLVGVICTVDSVKGDAELKLLIGCGEEEIHIICEFMNNQYMSAIFVARGGSASRSIGE